MATELKIAASLQAIFVDSLQGAEEVFALLAFSLAGHGSRVV